MHAMVLALVASCGAHAQYRLKPRIGPAIVASMTPTYVRVTVRVTFAVSPAVSGKSAHARGAYELARRAAVAFGGKVSAVAKNDAGARAALHTALLHFSADANHELRREEHLYDQITRNGSEQDQGSVYGFPRGADCPS